MSFQYTVHNYEKIIARSNYNNQLSFFKEISLAHMVISTDKKRQNSNKTLLNVYFVSPLKMENKGYNNSKNRIAFKKHLLSIHRR